MNREQTTIRLPAELKEFINMIKKLDKEKQAGLCLMTEGLKIMAEKKRHI